MTPPAFELCLYQLPDVRPLAVPDILHRRLERVSVAQVRQAEVLEGVGMDAAPPLRGYVRFDARPTADRILDADRTDPLFVRWQYG